MGAESVAEQGVVGGSLRVIHFLTRSPRRAATTPAYSAKRSAVPRFSQPPVSCSFSGRSVKGGYGRMPPRPGRPPAVVEVEAAGGVHAGPGDREAVRVHAEVGEEGHVLGVAVVVVAGHVRRRAEILMCRPRLRHERVPYRRVAFGRGSLDGGPRWTRPRGSRAGTAVGGSSMRRGIIHTGSKGSQRVGVNWELRLLGRQGRGAGSVSRLRPGGALAPRRRSRLCPRPRA